MAHTGHTTQQHDRSCAVPVHLTKAMANNDDVLCAAAGLVNVLDAFHDWVPEGCCDCEQPLQPCHATDHTIDLLPEECQQPVTTAHPHTGHSKADTVLLTSAGTNVNPGSMNSVIWNIVASIQSS